MLFQPIRQTGIDVIEEVSNVIQVGSIPHDTNIDESKLVAQKIRCCLCGIMITPNSNNTCLQCLKSQVDITEGISKTVQLHHCKECNRYQRPPWIACELESPQLLSLCLKHVKGLKRVKMVDAAFIWTEPHSRRLKVKMTVQKEVLNGTMLQQTFVIEFVI